MNTFFTADHHFGHGSILKHCSRPWATTAEMDEQLIANWNGMVTKKDTVIVDGDFAWKDHKKYINALNGKKTLIIGNHDKMDRASLEQFSNVIGSNKQPGTLEMVLDSKLIVIGHYRHLTWRASCHGSWHLYGHSHGRFQEADDLLACDIGVDVWDYAPVPWEVLKAKLGSRQAAWEGRKTGGSGKSWEEYDGYVNPLRLENRHFRELCHGGLDGTDK